MPTARFTYVEVALPAFQMFVQGYLKRQIGLRQDIERASVIADALLNLPDYLFASGESTEVNSLWLNARAYRESIWLQEPAYELACDFANAYKHRDIRRDGRKLNSIKDVIEVAAICRFSDEGGPYFRTLKRVHLRTVGGGVSEMRRLLATAMLAWQRELARLGVIPVMPDHLFSFSEAVPRNDAQMETPLELLARKGEHMELQLECMEFYSKTASLDFLAPNAAFQAEAQIVTTVIESPFDA